MDFSQPVKLNFSAHNPLSTFSPAFLQYLPQLSRSGLRRLYLVCQQVLKTHPFCKVACFSISRGQITQKNPPHMRHTILNTPKDQAKKAYSWSKLNFCFMDYTEGFPTALTCGGEHTFLRVIYEWLQAQMWISRHWQP